MKRCRCGGEADWRPGGDGTDAAQVLALETAAAKLGAQVQIVARKADEVQAADGRMLEADFQLAGGPSVLFDVVFVAWSDEGAKLLSTEGPP